MLVQVTSEHVSLEAAPPLEANQAAKSVALPFPSHSTAAFVACVAIVGLVVSTIVKLAVVEEALPQASVAVKIIETGAEQSFDKALKLFVHVILEHVSLALAPPLEANQRLIAF